MISVITPCYNQGEYLAKAIESVLRQTVHDFEYIVIDDGSTDSTAKVMAEYAMKNGCIQCYYLPKQDGVANVLNYGIKKMRGDVFVWVPADDTVSPDLLEKKLAHHDGKTVLYSWFNRMGGSGEHINEQRIEDVPPEQFFEKSYNQCFIGFTGIWIPKSVFCVAGLFPVHHAMCEDYYWMLKASKLGVPFRCVPEFLYNKRIHCNRTTDKCADNIPEVVKKIKQELS